MNKEELFNRNFVLVVIGQMVSIFGNSVLRFALPLYLLDQTGSTAIFGSTLAIAAIPTILFSPLGGILADRFSRRNLMVILDLLTAVVMAGFSFLLLSGPIVILTAILMVIFSIIQSFYQPAVQASIPVISSRDNLEKSNAIVSMVNSISNILGPVFAGIIYGLFSIRPIVLTAVFCFSIAAVMEMFIIMKFKRRKNTGGIIAVIKSDFTVSINYLIRDNPVMIKAMIITSGMNLFLTSLILVGLPSMIKLQLGLSSQLYGLAEGGMAAGTIVGGILISVFGRKLGTDKVYLMLLYSSLGLLSIAIAFTISLPNMLVYWVILVSCFLMSIFITIFSIIMMSFVQRITPDQLIGKIISYILAMSQCSIPIGQVMYGFLFEAMADNINLIVFMAAFLCSCIAIYSKKVFDSLSTKEMESGYLA